MGPGVVQAGPEDFHPDCPFNCVLFIISIIIKDLKAGVYGRKNYIIINPRCVVRPLETQIV